MCTALAICVTFLFAGGAGTAYGAAETIAGPGEGAGQVDFPVGVAVDQVSGVVYIADANNRRIDKFGPDGAFLLAWGFGVRDNTSAELQTCGPEASPPQSWCFRSKFLSNDAAGNVLPSAVAVHQSSGDVYVADTTKRRITKFTESGQFEFLVGKNVNATKVALGAGATQAEMNICTATSGDTCTSGASGTGPNENEFTSPRSLAVTPAGVVWVGDAGRLKSFDENGVPGAEIIGGGIAGAGNTQSLALNSAGDFYVKSASFAGIRKLETGTGTLLETLDAAGQARTVTVDATDNIYVGDATNPYRFMKFNSAGEQVAQFGAGAVIGAPGDFSGDGANALAFREGNNSLYAVSTRSGANSALQRFDAPEPGPLVEDQGVEDIEPTTATLTARINPENDETTYHFEYGTSESYDHSTLSETLAAEEFDPESVAVGIDELIPSTIYHFRVVASNECEPAVTCTATGPDQTFTTLPAVVIDPQWATDITAHNATVHAEMDPLGVEAEAWLEYGTSESYGTTVPLTNLGDGFGPVLRERSLGGLEAGTTYHYRFAARDDRGSAICEAPGTPCEVHGPDQTFTTQFGGLGFRLTDGRVWEMVSPPDKHGARLVGGSKIHLQAAAGGNGLAYQSILSTEVDPEGNRIPEPSMNLAARSSDGRWHSKDITTHNEEVSPTSGVSSGTEYKLFNSDLSEAVVEPRSFTLQSDEASERTPYLRENAEPATFRPLVTGKEPYANVPPAIEFGGKGNAPDVAMVGASPGFRHFVLTSLAELVEGPTVPGKTIYAWSNGQIEPVSVKPSGEGGALVEGEAGSGFGSARGVISEDGSRVFWSAGTYPSTTSGLYVRDTEADESARLDVKQPDASGIGLVRPVFQAASADGTVVFFTDPQQLTDDASSGGSDLYRCELPPGGIASGCATLDDISVPLEAGESAEVEGIAAGITADGKAIYFVARGVLDEAPSELGDSAASGEPNLYLWQQGVGVRFIATLAEADKSDWGELPSEPDGRASILSAAPSRSGRYLAFMSQRDLTGYDNRDRADGAPTQEVYRYDALTGQLMCASCLPTGGRPHGATSGAPLVNPAGIWKGLSLAAALPQPTAISAGGISLYHPRAVLDNGRVYFNAIDSLVPADSNGQWDSYQYEPTGVGDCSSSSGSPSISSSGQGCVSLISSGTGEDEAAFFDASETGDDAFFFTPARLSVLDEDSEVDIYDARVGGVEATLPADTECLGEACQPLAQAPNDPTPASAAFLGAGNIHSPARKRCRKGKRKVKRHGHVRCVPKKHRKAAKKHRRVTTNRRAVR